VAAAALRLDHSGEGGGSGGGGLDVPTALALVEAHVVETVMHEVGHCIGLRHNFKASAAYPWDQLANESFVETHGFTSSVMDYVPSYIPSNRSWQSRRPSGFVSAVVGAYDRHAIEYGYSVVEGEVDGVQPPKLAALAARGSHEVALAFATDEDGPRVDGVDPLTNIYDLGDDPIHYYRDRLALTQRLLLTAANRTVLAGESWTKQTAAVLSFINTALRAGAYIAKYVGGSLFSKAHKGDPHAADSMTPVPAADQARAVQLALQIISQPFWLPTAMAVRRMPLRTGYGCGELEPYCLGLKPPELLARVRRTREQVLLGLLQVERLSGLAQQEWELDTAEELGKAGAELAEAGAAGGTPPADGYALGGRGGSLYCSDWIHEPQTIPFVEALAQRPSVSALFVAIDGALSLPNTSALLAQPPSVAKMAYEMQRVWVHVLAQLSGQVDEQAAVAVQLLRGLRADTATRLGSLGAAAVDAAAATAASESDGEPHSAATARAATWATAAVSALHAHLLWIEHALDDIFST